MPWRSPTTPRRSSVTQRRARFALPRTGALMKLLTLGAVRCSFLSHISFGARRSRLRLPKVFIGPAIGILHCKHPTLALYRLNLLMSRREGTLEYFHSISFILRTGRSRPHHST